MGQCTSDARDLRRLVRPITTVLLLPSFYQGTMATFFISTAQAAAAAEAADVVGASLGPRALPASRRPSRAVTPRDLKADQDLALWRSILINKGFGEAPSGPSSGAFGNGHRWPTPAISGAPSDHAGASGRGRSTAATPGGSSIHHDAPTLPSTLDSGAFAGAKEAQLSADPGQSGAASGNSLSGRRHLDTISSFNKSSRPLEEVLEGASGIIGCVLRVHSCDIDAAPHA